MKKEFDETMVQEVPTPTDADMPGEIVAFLKKKSQARKIIAEKGVMKRGGSNKFDKYTYFTEAQYKELVTELLVTVGLELHSTVVSVEDTQGSSGQPFGRRVTYEVALQDIETGYQEFSTVVGEGFDKGDKAIYKAYTGAIKYWIADTFLVATGDDPENDKDCIATSTVDVKTGEVKEVKKAGLDPTKPTAAQIKMAYARINKLGAWPILKSFGVSKPAELNYEQFQLFMKALDEKEASLTEAPQEAGPKNAENTSEKVEKAENTPEGSGEMFEYASSLQLKKLSELYSERGLLGICEKLNLQQISDISKADASRAIEFKIKEKEAAK